MVITFAGFGPIGTFNQNVWSDQISNKKLPPRTEARERHARTARLWPGHAVPSTAARAAPVDPTRVVSAGLETRARPAACVRRCPPKLAVAWPL